MKGSIRFFLGLIVVTGAIGTLDIDPDASLVTSLIISLIGLIIMYSGTVALKGE
jgi:hypothetical protein